jgi:superfamily II DNA or RNA helicase
MSLPSAIIDADDLSADFDPPTIVRGERYADEGRVRDVKWSAEGRDLHGSCLGSGDRIYRVSIYFDEDGVAWTRCSCPVGLYCKHAVALILTATRDAPTADPDHWRTVLANVLSETATPEAGIGAPVALQFSLTSPSRYVPVRAVTVRPLTMGKRGKWITTGLTWQRLAYEDAPAQFQHGQYQALRGIACELERSSPLIGATMYLTTAGSALWPLLCDAVDAGVTMVANTASGLTAVEFVKNAQLRLEFVSDDAGGAVMSATPIVYGEPCRSTSVGLIGAPPHGIYTVEDGVIRLGPFDPLPGPTTLNLISRGERVRIPAAAAQEFSLTVLPRLTRAVPVEVEDGLFTPPTVVGPLPVLTITVTDTGARAWWSTRYEVNDQRHDFGPDSPLRPTGFRDEVAEVAAWQRVTPALRAVAAASRTWNRQAMQHIFTTLDRTMSAAILEERRAIIGAGDSAGAVAVASLDSLRRSVDLTNAEVAVLCAEILPQLDCLDHMVVEIDDAARRFRAPDTEPQLHFSSADAAPTDWFDLDITVDVDGYNVPLADILTELAAGATHMALPSGVYFQLDADAFLRLRELIEEARALGEIDNGRVNTRSLNATLWDELLAFGVVDKQIAAWRENLARLATARPPGSVEVPATLDATLRDYQRDGFEWLSFLWDNGLGGVLADDMGLGKTVQTLALIARANEAGAHRFLVVAPTSVVTNWATECRKFTPGLDVVAVTATDARSGVPLAERAAAAHIVITSYTLLRIDFDAYAQIDWAGVILDEAQFVKNHNSKTHQCVRRLDAPFKLAVTGTPMENNLMELWSLLSITVPGLFPSPAAFTEYFRKPIESATNNERLPVLRRRIKPIMLRRTKSQVATELPPKQEQLMALDLGAKHRKIYDTRLARERQKVLGLLGEWEKNRFQIFRSLTLLRQLSLHAGLVDDTNIHVASAKIDYLVTQLPELVAEGHSALVFSQFTGFLGILRSHLDSAGLDYSYLDGSVGGKGRAAAIAEFRSGATKVFLISLKAGGFGLNLTEADYCFVCDPWWSPAAEAQAVDRAHRIGQTRPVSVYRLVSQGTIEEKVVALQDRKRELFGAVIDNGEIFGSPITAADVRDLLG